MSEEEQPKSTMPEAAETATATSAPVSKEDAPPALEEGSDSFVSAVLGDMSDRPPETDSEEVVAVYEKPAESTTEEVSPPEKDAELTAENAPVLSDGEINSGAADEETVGVPVEAIEANGCDEAPSTLGDILAQVAADNADRSLPDDTDPSGLAAESATPSESVDANVATAASAEPTKRGLVGRLGKMLSDRRLKVGSEKNDSRAAPGDNDCESVDEEEIIDGAEGAKGLDNHKESVDVSTEATEPPKRGLIGRLGKMLSDRRLNVGPDGGKSTQGDNDCESVDEEIIDGVEEDVEGVDNDKPSGDSDEGASDPSDPQKIGLLGRIGKILSDRRLNVGEEDEGDDNGPKEHPDEVVVKTDDIEGETMEERAMKRRGLLKRIGSYVEEKELLKRLSNRNLLRSLSKDKLADGSSKTGNAALIEECILAAEDENGLEGEGDSQDGVVDGSAPSNGVFSRIGKIITDHRSNAGTSVSDSDVADDLNAEESRGDVDESSAPDGARRGFLKGLRDIVSSRSLDRSALPTEDNGGVSGEMVNGGSIGEPQEGQPSSIIRRGRGLVSRINSFIARDSALEEEDPADVGEGSQVQASTAALDELMKSGARCPPDDIASGLALVDAELKKDLPEQRHEYLLTLQCYLLKQQALQVNVVTETPEKSEDQEGALAA